MITINKAAVIFTIAWKVRIEILKIVIYIKYFAKFEPDWNSWPENDLCPQNALLGSEFSFIKFRKIFQRIVYKFKKTSTFWTFFLRISLRKMLSAKFRALNKNTIECANRENLFPHINVYIYTKKKNDYRPD